MADIFISYSSKDKEKAEQLTELLASAGLSVWIDQSRLEVSTSWSAEIVDAINSCEAFIVLLSPNSIESHNVIKEVSLASEKRKKILPLDLEPITLPRELEYQLAGIHRAPMSNIDSIIRALGKLGLVATSAPTITLIKETDGRKSLMILPFEDLSPTGDNQWFADGIVSELISALSNVKALRVTDAATTREYKTFKGHLTTYASEMQIRYFIQGDVRKFGDQIKISSRLLDIETGDHLWQDSMKGTMEDIFDIQEKVAEKVVEGLKVHLASDEKKKLAERGTKNAEAYELSMRASEYYARQTKEGFQLSVQLISEAIRLDPGYAQAYQFKAKALAVLYGKYNRTPAVLDEAEALCKEALRLRPDAFGVYGPLSLIYMQRGQLAEAEAIAKEYVRKCPHNHSAHFTLGFVYSETDQAAKAISPYEEAVRLKPEDLPSLFNLVLICEAAGAIEKCVYWGAVALPHAERHLKLHPDDESMRVQHALLLLMSGRTEDAHTAATKLTNLQDGRSLYNTACLFGQLGDKSEALRTFRKAIEAGFTNPLYLNDFLSDERDGIVSLSGTPEYEDVKKMVARLEADGKQIA